MFQHCLICTDFNDGLQRLVKFIPDLAKGGFKRIVFLHAVSVWEDERVASVDEERVIEAEKYFASILKDIPDGIEVKTEVTTVRYLDTILELVKTHAIDLILLGTPVQSNLEAKFLGSHTLELSKATKIPLMILRPQLISTYTNEELSLRCQHLWRYLLIPYDDSPASKYLVQHLKEYVINRSENAFQECLLIWVVEDGGRNVELTQYHLEKAQRKLDEVKQELENLNIAVHTQVCQGNPINEILKLAIDFDVSAIATSNYRGNFLEWTVSSTAENLLERSWFPMLFCSAKS
jgi:nucleotide-binding universal stress UspA family protein